MISSIPEAGTLAIDEVNAAAVWGQDVFVDDMVLAAGWSRWWYSVSDLNTVLPTTDADGERLGTYAPDFYGNYRTVAGERPDAMGLTTKFEDPLTGAACAARSRRRRFLDRDDTGHGKGVLRLSEQRVRPGIQECRKIVRIRVPLRRATLFLYS